ncbi:hypothetical protein HMPREF1173_00361 [Prevotella nigrescens CC14M]|uniref:Uncharacterized protein n=1 Tax=Prevotella nigrescens CC14M TaxID=1073366 RepID=V8CSH1_9BACT|nr:hypothetical protein HMPREF1173_00361 [Prevotella nigrescens CC14M]
MDQEFYFITFPFINYCNIMYNHLTTLVFGKYLISSIQLCAFLFKGKK